MSIELIKISEIVNQLAEEKGMDKETVIKAITESIAVICEKQGLGHAVNVLYNKKTDSIAAYNNYQVVSEVKDDKFEIDLKKALSYNKLIEIGQELKIPFKIKLGRVEIIKIKQLINQKIKQIEAEAIYKEFGDKKGSLISGTVNKISDSGITISLYEYLAFLPKSLMIQGEKPFIGAVINAIVKEVYQVPREEESIILERTSNEFIHKLLELEIPEIYEGIVRIEKIVRVPGYKTKVLVSSRDSNISPVGTCIGVGGARIKPILRELGMEKLDLIAFTAKTEEMIARSLKPAEVISVEIKGDIAYATIKADQKAAAVGRGGKNVSMASQITGISIEIVEEA